LARTAAEFYKEYQKRLGEDCSLKDAKRFARAYADTIVDLLAVEDYIRLPHFGTITVNYLQPYGVIDEPYFRAYFRFAERARRAYKYKIIED